MIVYLKPLSGQQLPSRKDVVNNDYATEFVSLTYNWYSIINNKKHKSMIRLEKFSVDDNDTTWGDNNNETGDAVTLNHHYCLNGNWFLSAKFNHIDTPVLLALTFIKMLT